MDLDRYFPKDKNGQHMRRCLTSLTIREIKILKNNKIVHLNLNNFTMQCHSNVFNKKEKKDITSYLLRWLLLKRQEISVQKKGPMHTSGGNGYLCSH